MVCFAMFQDDGNAVKHTENVDGDADWDNSHFVGGGVDHGQESGGHVIDGNESNDHGDGQFDALSDNFGSGDKRTAPGGVK